MIKLLMRGKNELLIIISVLLIILILIRLYIDHNVLNNTKYTITSDKIPEEFDGYKIIQLSDLHGKNLSQKIISYIDVEKPNIIVMTGDMVSANKANYDTFFELSKNLSNDYPIYYIKGNHEGRMYNASYESIENDLKSISVNILDNEKIRIENKGQYISLYGMWINQRFYSRLFEDEKNILKVNDIEKLVGKCDENEYNVLLIHTPKFFDAYNKWGADLVLSGHIHGGLIRIPFIGGVISPYLELFPKYCYGKYEKNNTTMIISSGLSRGGAGIRFFNKPEIVTIVLKRNNERN